MKQKINTELNEKKEPTGIGSSQSTEILKKLEEKLPDVKCELIHKNAYELLVAVILSAQCTDKRVNLVTPRLFAKYPTPQDLAVAKPKDVITIIRSTGFFNNKTKNIIACANMLITDYDSKVPDRMEELLKLPGVARKTANVILGEWYKKAEGITVDTHVKRVALHLGLTKYKDPVKIERDLMKTFPKEKWIYLSQAFVHYGRYHCPAKRNAASDCWLDEFAIKKEVD